MKKVLIIYPSYHHYRIDFFNALANKVELTVIHSGKKTYSDEFENIKFNEIILPYYKFGPFVFRPSLHKYTFKYDYYIISSNLRWINSMIFFLTSYKKKKIILWGNWFTNSKIANKFRLYLSKKSFSNIFYHQYTKCQFVNAGICEKSCFVANNTIDINHNLVDKNQYKNKILVVGSLNERKKIEIIIKSFCSIHVQIPNITLDIIGSGDHYDKLKELASINKKIIFHGRITNKKQLSYFYNKAICEVSPMQAGLSVLQSMGFGVPFITYSKALTGGEIYNIIDGYNGFLYTTVDELNEILLRIIHDLKYSDKLHSNARQYYLNYCTNQNMVNGFIDSLYHTNTTVIDSSNYKII